MKKISKTKQPAMKHAGFKKDDIIELLLEDHKPLKRLIKLLKDADSTFHQKKIAYREFTPLLLQHAKAEEQSLYVHLKVEKEELRQEGHEGDTEHEIASELIAKINRTRNKDAWMAKTKVLGELVEHHIEEEEEDVFGHIRKTFKLEARAQIGREYLRFKVRFQRPGAKANLSFQANQYLSAN